ncbi:uncharacterized protein DUF4905 [Mucilaginibacter gracilis]|uniref:Uncharacterized protein DUF4905 n=1 Tax=Mucilaginibacter gracilis TaxID=423350 RepID=A0A495J718_9SPHI|nr:DUF4905 domain-containing protein [Mucilaginibacter gracilis]RKR84392.1 uncharacterized protein DUF4905 [Mucilaginibacter gracilis]
MTKLKTYIQQLFSGQIWKMEIDASRQLLYIETRNTQSRTVRFSAFDMLLGKANFIDFALDEQWLAGIEGSFNGVLFLHGYQSAQSPVHKGITAINGNNGQVLWSNYTYAIHHISTGGPVAYNTQVQPQKLFILDAQNGAILRPFNEFTDADINPDIQFPHGIQTLADDIKPYISGDLRGNIDYMEYNSFRIVSLHSLIKTDLSQTLLIMQGNNLVYEDLLIDGIQKLQPEAFIMHQNRLIYIKNKIELKVLNL